MDLGLKDKVALVHAAGSGLGRAIALGLGVEGMHVVVAGRRIETVRATAAAINESGGKSFALEWDLGDLGVIDGCVSAIEARFGPVDVLVNNTGGPPPTTAAGQNPALWMKQFEAMVLSVIATTDRVLPGMRERKWGRVITSTSSGVISPIPNLAVSNALRMSLVGWSKTLAREVGAYGITTNIILPGRIATDRIGVLDEAKARRENRTVEVVQQESIATIPLGRYGTPEEYADTVAFIASKRASYVTGSVIRVDGGLIASI